MAKNLLTLAAALMLGLSYVSLSSEIADADGMTARASRSRVAAAKLHCQKLWRCAPGGCDWYRLCTRPCPDGYSCTPLYGAYDPYGGIGYWGGYTDTGWMYRP